MHNAPQTSPPEQSVPTTGSSGSVHSRSASSQLDRPPPPSSRNVLEIFSQQPGALCSFPSTNDTVWTTLPRTFGDVEVSATAIDDCFRIFFTRYSPQFPAIEGEITPNDCYEQSPYLCLTIITIGSRRYTRDPTLFSQLSPQLTEYTKHAAFSRETSLHTIQAFMLNCAWPLPQSSLSRETTHIVSGVLLQHALSVGLHIFGVGQDFSRVKLQEDRALMYLRARLWVLCIVICQR